MGLSWLRRARWLVVPAVVLPLLGVWGYHTMARRARDIRDPELSRGEQRPVAVRTASVSTAPVTAVVGATALTVPAEEVSIRVGLSRRIEDFSPAIRAVHVHDGSEVKTGQLLFELETTHFEQAVSTRQAALQAALANLARGEAEVEQNAVLRQVELDNAAEEVRFRTASVDFHGQEHERVEKLHQGGNATPTERLEAAAAHVEAQAALTRARVREELAKAEMVRGPLRDQSELKLAAETLEQARLDLAVAESDLERCRLRSPLNGYMDEVSIASGQIIDASTVLGRVLRIDPIHVRLDFPQERIDELAVGQPVEVVFDTFPQETFHGKVARVPVAVDTRNRVLPVVVEVPNPEQRVKVGVSGYGRVHVSRQATIVPAVAVIRLDAKAMVFVVEDGWAHIREVQTGPILQPGELEVRAGLEPGDEVVVYGQQYLQDNERVDTNWRKWARRE
jgi:HlyD family secretion protein